MDNPVLERAERGSVARRLHARVVGDPAGRPIVFTHGLGTDQHLWDRLVPTFEAAHRIVLFDHAGCGGADPDAHDPRRHATLHGYAEDLVGLLDELALGPVVHIGHSAGGMIGLLAHVRRPDLFDGLVLIGASPRYLDDDGYRGGFSVADVDGFLEAMESNYLGWAGSIAPLAMGNADRPELAEELERSFARAEQQRAIAFARAIFTSDHREALPRVTVPTLTLQAADDPMVPAEVAEYLHEHLPADQLVHLAASGHFPHLSGPDETVAAIRAFLDTVR